MPSVLPVTALGFEDLIEELGIQSGPRAPFWFLSDTIIPVSLVNSQITIPTELTEPVDTWVSEGQKSAPASGTVLADTGQLAAGNYTFKCVMSTEGVSTATFCEIEHRNAGNSADIISHHFGQDSGGLQTHHELRFTIALAVNERVRVIQNGTPTAGSSIQASIFYHAL